MVAPASQTNILFDQIDLLDRQANELRGPLATGPVVTGGPEDQVDELASIVFDARSRLEGVIAFGMAIFRSLEHATRRYNAQAQQRNVGFHHATAELICDLYRKWYRACEHLLPRVKDLSRIGYPLDAEAEFQRAFADAQMIGFHFDRVVRAMENVRRGQIKSLAEGIDAVRHRPGA